MSFKLLAIRPLPGTDQKFLKNLKPGVIYKFYQEYGYFNENEIDISNYTSTERRTKVIDDKVVNYWYYINSEIAVELSTNIVVKKNANDSIPHNFYNSKNNPSINISAIVGKNGSGKSALLELLNLFIYNISSFLGIVRKSYRNLNMEIFYSNNDRFSQIKLNNGQLTYIENNDHENVKSYCSFKDLKDLVERNKIFNFYTNVINYSLYGLNSKHGSDYLNEDFYKNDTYQMPIVINPFRKDGNIDVNREYDLAQQRLVLNHYIIKNKLLDNVSIERVEYTVLTDKYFYIDEKKKTFVIDEILNFYPFDNENLKDNNFFRDFVKIVAPQIHYDNFTRELTQNHPNFTNLTSFDHIQPKNTKIYLQYYSLLYIFRKIRKIVINYTYFSKYTPLFRNENLISLDEPKIDHLKNLEERLKTRFDGEIDNVNKQKLKQLDLFQGIEDLQQEMSYITNKILNDENIKGLNKAIDQALNYIFLKIRISRKNLFIQLIKEIKENKDHKTFKIKQALSYFETDFFSSIDHIVRADNNKKIVVFKKQYFQHFEDNIEKVPIAIFEPHVKVQKGGYNYDFNRLSSGEQQKIHSLMTITYHLFNLQSKHKNNKSKEANELIYKNVNLIFDEVELYFHPDYQREFISNLVDSLSYFKGMNFNIIFSTHSPFILSDIPSQNILKLKDGIPVESKNNLNSFAANIHDLLNDEFFLEKGSIGELARTKLEELDKKITFSEDDLKTIELIGDEFLKSYFLDKVSKAKIDEDVKQARIKMLEEELNRLKK